MDMSTAMGRACRWCPLIPFRSMRAEIRAAEARPPIDAGLAFHGDRELADGLVDLAVNVRPGMPPPWLADRIRAAVAGLASYPDPGPATEAVAGRHARPPAEVLVTAGAAEAFTLIARAFRPRRAVIVHPQFTEPEAALRAAGYEVGRVILGGDFRLDPALVPGDADLVVVGNPTNPTSVLHPAAAIRALARPGRLLVVDEAFADCVPGEPESLAADRGVPGLIVVRSLTKTWGLAGLRAGYVLAGAAHVDAMAGARPPWAVSSPALAAVIACCEPRAIEEAAAWAQEMNTERDRLAVILNGIPGVLVTAGARASFLLLRVAGGRDGRRKEPSAGGLGTLGEGPSAGGLGTLGEEPSAGGPSVRERLRRAGFAVRRGDTFPGLGPEWLRVAVRDRATNDRFATALRQITRESDNDANT
jgi:histidinol-phosphate aminotransferase